VGILENRPVVIAMVAACAGPAAVAPTREPASAAPTPSASPSAALSVSASTPVVGSAEPPSNAPDVAIAPWSPKGAVSAELSEKTPLTAHGVSLVLTRFGHKQMVKGPVVGIWEWELRKGGAAVTGSYTGKKLFGELSAFGVLAVIESDNGPIKGTLVPFNGKPFTEADAADFAEKEHERRNLPKTKNGTGYNVSAGVMYFGWTGDPKVEMTIGMHSRRVIAISIKKAAKAATDDD
jgi:hypothetical protein